MNKPMKKKTIDNKKDTSKDTSKEKENRFEQALNLPTICNLNPRSIYNKADEFHTLVEEEELDLIFISESWEMEYLPLDQKYLSGGLLVDQEGSSQSRSRRGFSSRSKMKKTRVI